MKIVMTYSEGDGCTYSCDHTYPFEFESAEAAIVEFERLFNEANVPDPKRGYIVGQFTFCGFELNVCTFKDGNQVYLPEFYTLDEWFEKCRLN